MQEDTGGGDAGRGDLAPTGDTQGVGVGSPDPNQRTAEGIRKEALEHLDFAIAQFRAMKMQPALERALRLRERLTA